MITLNPYYLSAIPNDFSATQAFAATAVTECSSLSEGVTSISQSGGTTNGTGFTTSSSQSVVFLGTTPSESASGGTSFASETPTFTYLDQTTTSTTRNATQTTTSLSTFTENSSTVTSTVITQGIGASTTTTASDTDFSFTYTTSTYSSFTTFTGNTLTDTTETRIDVTQSTYTTGVSTVSTVTLAATGWSFNPRLTIIYVQDTETLYYSTGSGGAAAMSDLASIANAGITFSPTFTALPVASQASQASTVLTGGFFYTTYTSSVSSMVMWNGLSMVTSTVAVVGEIISFSSFTQSVASIPSGWTASLSLNTTISASAVTYLRQWTALGGYETVTVDAGGNTITAASFTGSVSEAATETATYGMTVAVSTTSSQFMDQPTSSLSLNTTGSALETSPGGTTTVRLTETGASTTSIGTYASINSIGAFNIMNGPGAAFVRTPPIAFRLTPLDSMATEVGLGTITPYGMDNLHTILYFPSQDGFLSAAKFLVAASYSSVIANDAILFGPVQWCPPETPTTTWINATNAAVSYSASQSGVSLTITSASSINSTSTAKGTFTTQWTSAGLITVNNLSRSQQTSFYGFNYGKYESASTAPNCFILGQGAWIGSAGLTLATAGTYITRTARDSLYQLYLATPGADNTTFEIHI